MSDRRGAMLIMSYLVVAFLIMWVLAGFQQSATELTASERYIDSLQAFNISQARRNRALSWLRTQPAPPGGTAAFDPFGGSQALAGGTFTATIDPHTSNPTSYLNVYTITVTGQVTDPPVSRQISQWVRTAGFARFSYFTNSERSWWYGRLVPIWFTSFDYL